MKTGLALSILAFALFSAGAARAQRFGDGGELVIQDDTKLQIGGTTGTGSGANALVLPALGSSNTGANLYLEPAADYFVVPEVSLGAALLYANSAGSQVFGVAPRVGYNIPITGEISFWVKGYLGYAHAWVDGGGHADTMYLEAFAPLLWHPATHFFLGAGPYVVPSFNLTASQSDVAIGVETTIGGWFTP